MLGNLSVGRTAVLVALTASVSAGVFFAPTALAQSGSRVCSKVLQANNKANQSPDYYLYLVEVNKSAFDHAVIDDDAPICNFVGPEVADEGYTEVTDVNHHLDVYMDTCEDVATRLNWAALSENLKPEGYNGDDICTSMSRETEYKVSVEGEGSASVVTGWTTA